MRSCLTPDEQFDFPRWATDGMPKVTPLWLLKYLPNMPASHVAIYNDLRGPNNSITLREASGDVGRGGSLLHDRSRSRGHHDCGGDGDRLHPLRTIHVTLQEECAAGDGEPEKMCRPFDLNRTGMVLGEGAGAIVVEELAPPRPGGPPFWPRSSVSVPRLPPIRSTGGNIRQAMENVVRQALAKARTVAGRVRALSMRTGWPRANAMKTRPRRSTPFSDREASRCR